MEMYESTQISKIVKDTFAKEFPEIKIVNVKVSHQLDDDGDHVLRIFIIFEWKKGKVDPKKLAGAVRYLRPKLNEIKETAFPLLSFITKSDAEQTGFEPA